MSASGDAAGGWQGMSGSEVQRGRVRGQEEGEAMVEDGGGGGNSVELAFERCRFDLGAMESSRLGGAVIAGA